MESHGDGMSLADQLIQQAVRDDAKGEFAWVIECDFHSKMHYWAGRSCDDWRTDHLDALRFARRADAELMLTYHCSGRGRVVEHGWMQPSPTGK